jgi:hypothetical protein
MLAHGFAWRERCDRQPKLHGPGATGFRRMGFPNPIRSDTSCRGTTSPPAGDSGLVCDPTEGRLTRASAKKTGIRRTRGAFHRRAGSHRGSGVIHSLSPRCGEHRCHHGTPALFALPRVPLPLTRPRRRGAGCVSGEGITSARSRSSGRSVGFPTRPDDGHAHTERPCRLLRSERSAARASCLEDFLGGMASGTRRP